MQEVSIGVLSATSLINNKGTVSSPLLSPFSNVLFFLLQDSILKTQQFQVLLLLKLLEFFCNWTKEQSSVWCSRQAPCYLYGIPFARPSPASGLSSFSSFTKPSPYAWPHPYTCPRVAFPPQGSLHPNARLAACSLLCGPLLMCVVLSI